MQNMSGPNYSPTKRPNPNNAPNVWGRGQPMDRLRSNSPSLSPQLIPRTNTPTLTSPIRMSNSHLPTSSSPTKRNVSPTLLKSPIASYDSHGHYYFQDANYYDESLETEELISSRRIHPPYRPNSSLLSGSGMSGNSSVSSALASPNSPEGILEGLDMSRQGFRKLTPQIAIFSSITCLFLNDNQLSEVPDALFTGLAHLTRLDLSNNQFTSIPSKIGNLIKLCELSYARNRIRDIPMEIGKLCHLKTFNLEGNPINFPAQGFFVPNTGNFLNPSNGAEQLVSYLRERLPLPPRPPPRKWIKPDGSRKSLQSKYATENKTKETENSKKANRIRVLCYNILAEKLALPELCCFCPLKYLNWNYRKDKILKEIASYSCDLVALQEVEAQQFSEFFEPELKKLGYAGHFKPKSRVRTMADWTKVDGCAVFWLRDKWDMKSEVWIEFQAGAIERYEKEFPGNSEVLDRLLNKDQIALVTHFKLKDSFLAGLDDAADDDSYQTDKNKPNNSSSSKKNGHGVERELCFVNTHIHWDPAYADVKLMQACILVEELEKIKKKMNTSNRRFPIIICGDFNSLPTSGVYGLLQTGMLQPSHKEFGGQNYGRYSEKGIAHELRLNSAYSHLGEPPFTNYTDGFVGTLDYVFYSTESIKVRKVLAPVDEHVILEQFGALPNAWMCSDHIALGAEFEWI